MDHIINLNEFDNPEYFSLISQHKKISDEWRRVNSWLISFRLPLIFLFGKKKELVLTAGVPLENLEKEFHQWVQEADKMTVHPSNIKIPPSTDSQIIFCHYIGVLRDLRNTCEVQMISINGNYNRIYDNINIRLSFIIAITSFLFSFVGCAFTIWLGIK